MMAGGETAVDGRRWNDLGRSQTTDAGADQGPEATRVGLAEEHRHHGEVQRAGHGSPPSSATSGPRNAGGGDNLHRNVIYRDGKAKADQVVPMTTYRQRESRGPLEVDGQIGRRRPAAPCSPSRTTATSPTARCSRSTTFMAIRSRANGPNLAPAGSRCTRSPRSRATARPHPSLSPTDEFAGFESWDQANLAWPPSKTRHAGARVRPRGAAGRTQARSGSWAPIRSSSASPAGPTPTRG